MKTKQLAIAACVGLLASPLANAIIVDGTIHNITPKNDPLVSNAQVTAILAADFIKVVPPNIGSSPANTVGKDNFDDFNLRGFDEDQNVAVGPGGLSPDIGAFLPEGTTVASHYIFWDPETLSIEPRRAFKISASVVFDATVLAIFHQTGTLFASDYLSNTGVTFLNPDARGLESGNTVEIDANNSMQININWAASTPGDYIRVLTAYSPGGETRVPDTGATFASLGLGLLAMAGIRRYRKLRA